jgi:predicted RNase H-like HicB family nuclease
MTFDDYKILLYKQDDGWVAEIPALAGCYALMPTREETLTELRQIFNLIAEEYGERGEELPADTADLPRRVQLLALRMANALTRRGICAKNLEHAARPLVAISPRHTPCHEPPAASSLRPTRDAGCGQQNGRRASERRPTQRAV